MMKSGFNVFSVATKSFEIYRRMAERVNRKISGTFAERSVNFLKSVYTDYKEVAVQVRADMKAKPIKATAFFAGMGFLGYSMTHNPSEQSFRAKFIQCANDVCLVSSQLVQPSAVEHLNMIQTSYNRDLIRYASFGFFSVIWVDKYSDQCDMYETNCSYLQIPYSKIAHQVIDVGFLNIWWIISRKMLDYDINY